MNKKGKIASTVALTGVIILSTGIALGFTYGQGAYTAPPTQIKMLSGTETVWRRPGPTKISPANLGATTSLSTSNEVVTSFDVIDPTNTYQVPADTARTVISKKETTLKKEYESNNNNLYVYFVINTTGTTLRNTTGTFPATFDTGTKVSNVVTVTNVPIEFRVAWSFKTKDSFDVLANYTASFKYSYMFQEDPEGKATTKVLTLKIEDFMIKNGTNTVALKNSTEVIRKASDHEKDTFFFEPSSVIQTGF